MISPKPLLTDLQKWVTKFENDLRQRCREAPELDASLKADWQKARDSKRTAEAYEVWRDGQLTQSAVGWVLGCVFVRFLEDNQLLDRPWIAGTGDLRTEAEHVRDVFFTQNPALTDRDYLQHVFTEVGKLPGMADLFDRRHNALWRAGISGDAAADFIAFWRKMNHDFTDTDWGTRFLGDLYQDLSEYAKKTFALLQTPDFIEQFILDRTLNLAVERFGYEQVRMIDPTCGSGHFVLGGFQRLLTHWQKEHPEMNEREIVKNALAGVAGVDLNPFAVAIARFRLLLEAWKACAVTRLRAAPNFHVNLAVGDSLLHGPVPGELTSPEALKLRIESTNNTYSVELPDELARILGQRYHAVVGNPPYITVKDKALSETYRLTFRSCKGKYSLSVPFMERFFDLAVKGDGTPRQLAGFVGQITANSFMKREFGKKLIEEYLTQLDLTHVLDTSGAYIPGHGTPTVILFGKNQAPVSSTIRTVLGIRGEPAEPTNPEQGVVWQAICRQIDHPGDKSEWVSSANSSRTIFGRHPWSIGGGGASDLKEELDDRANQSLGSYVDQLRGKPNIGITAFTLEDDAFIQPGHVFIRHRLDMNSVRIMVEGDTLRDWVMGENDSVVWPYDSAFRPIAEDLEHPALRLLWLTKTNLANNYLFGQETKVEAGLKWYEFGRLTSHKLRTPLSICWGEVATHNHFALDRGGKVFKNSVQVIKLKPDATEDEHCVVLGLLNSSVACFWLKQVCQPKGTVTGDISSERGRPEANRYSFNASAVAKFPLPDLNGTSANRVGLLAKELDLLASRLQALEPTSILHDWSSNIERKSSLLDVLQSAASDHARAHAQAVKLQEELDWATYELYGLCDDSVWSHLTEILSTDGIDADWRPFCWSDETAPIVLSAQLQRLYERRRKLLKCGRLQLIENGVCKRPWFGRQGVYGSAPSTYKEKQSAAFRTWLSVRLETAFFEGERIAENGQNTTPANLRNSFAAGREPRLCTTRQLADVVSHDLAFMQAASVYRDREDFDLPKLVQELVENESVPFLPIQRYKDSGLRKRVIWERTWDLQRQEDQIEEVVRKENADKGLSEEKLKPIIQAKLKELVGDIPVPPKYASADFKKSHWWKLRGKLDVPKERWIIYSGTDTPSVIAWAGWNHKQQAQALAGYYQERKDQDGWSNDRLAPLLAGLKDLLPWLKQWHNDIDPEFQLRMGDFYEGYLREQVHELGMNEAQIEELRIGGPS